MAKLARDHGVLRDREGDSRASRNPEWMAELSLRLASNPGDAVAWAGADRGAAMRRLMEIPILARAARFVVLATEAHSESGVMPGEVYAGWTWT